jgi:phosphohistidine phosphatase SixA
MKRLRAVVACGLVGVGLALAGTSGAATPTSDETGRTAKTETIQALTRGGYVIVVRHATTEFGEVDMYPLDLANASAQRTLSDLGRLEARGLGKALKAAGVPVGRVYASALRRAAETAEYLGFESWATSVDLAEDAAAAPEEVARRADVLRQLMAIAPAPGTNNVIVAHKPNIIRVLGEAMASILPVEMVIVQPLPGGRMRVVDRLTKEDWRAAVCAANCGF